MTGFNLINNLKLEYHRKVTSRFTKDDRPHPSPVTVMMPLAPKDLDRARITLAALREQLVHPIARMVLIGPDDPRIQALADELGIEAMDETAALAPHMRPETLASMRGYFRQQFLKLLGNRILGAEFIVTMDADTRPIRPTAFIASDGRQILYRGDRNSIPYNRFTEALIGPVPRGSDSFVAHCMLFRRATIDALAAKIEAHTGQDWVEATAALAARPIDQVGAMSEFDLYAHFLLQTAPHAIEERYYSNIKVNPAQFTGETPLPRWKTRFRFVSNHERGA